MNKQELIDAIKKGATSHYDAGVSKVVIEAVLASLAETVAAELALGGEVTIPGIGKLGVKERAARTGRNPSTGAEIDIPARKVPDFTAAKALKEAVA